MNIERITKSLEKNLQAIIYRSAPFIAALGMGILYAHLIHESIGGVTGWILGAILAAGLEFPGMHVFSIAAKEKKAAWYFLSALYVLTHVSTLILVEVLDVQNETIVGISLIIAAILAYTSLGYKNSVEAQRLETEAAIVDELKEEKRKIDLTTYKDLQAEKVRDLTLRNKQSRKSEKGPATVRKSPAKVRPESEPESLGLQKVQFSDLSPEEQKKLLSLSWKKYQDEFSELYGPIAKSTFYEKRKMLNG